MPKLNVNGEVREHEAEPDTPLLWVLREQLGLTGTKYGCGVAQCGACTVHIDGAPRAQLRHAGSAVQPARRSSPSRGCRPTARHPLQKAWLALDVPQCGYCQTRHDHGGGGAAEDEAEADRRRHRRGDDQHLPLRHLQPRARRDQAGGGHADDRSASAHEVIHIERRTT